MNKKSNKNRIVRAIVIGGKVYEKRRDGSLVPLKDRTNWKMVDRMTGREIEAISATDRDGPPLSDAAWAKAKLVDPFKQPITIRLDRDVVSWFKARGRGYQTRINIVLRRYMDAQSRAG
jgi:uncharacterized protein (DUF4415 family)